MVLAIEKKSIPKLQDPRTVKKICMLDDHICAAFSGLTADARVLINKARIECQSHRLSVEDPVSVEYISRHIAGIQQKFTQKGGVRPFGVCTLIMGFDNKNPKLFLTEPSGRLFFIYANLFLNFLGIHSEWLANAIGRNSKIVREFLEKNHVLDMDRDKTIKLAIKALLEVVQTGASGMEIALMDSDLKVNNLDTQTIQNIINEIDTEKQAEQERKVTTISR